MTIKLSCFKAYDLRGQVPAQLNEDVAYRVGRAFAEFLDAKTVVVGHDIRLTSPSLTDALIEGITDAGCDVLHIGQCGTEEIYFATFDLGVDGGICVTASHNPIDYNGMKFVREGARPISGDSGLHRIQAMAEQGEFKTAVKGQVHRVDHRQHYIQSLLDYVDRDVLKPLKIVVNAGNGGAGAVIDAIEPLLPFEFIKIQHEPDGHFPNGIPNPLLPDNRQATVDAVIASGADMGIAWDGDFDRCFFFDEQGSFIEGYYIVGLLAQAFLLKEPGASIVHDPRLTWNTVAIVEEHGGKPIECKTGHAYIKERMRVEDAVYGGEMSAHHYFRDFAYCDNGTIPWLLVAELLSLSDQPLSAMVADRVAAFPCSGEINNTVENAKEIIQAIEEKYAPTALKVDKLDGLSIAYENWRFNIRISSTEPVLRLNVEARADVKLMEEKTAELLAQINRAC